MGNMLGVMLDCSRNAVMRVETIKQYADIIKKMGYNTLMLYTEDTYEVDNQPFFGYLRGRYTKSEIKELDSYCNSIGIELVPCIQTLAHLNAIFKWNDVYGDICDCDDILLAGEDKTYELINDMFATLSQCYTTKKIHIGMDEAYRVGLGKYHDINGPEDRFDIINKHLHKVCEIADRYGFEPMIWSDMFCKLALNSDDYYSSNDTEKIALKANLPENISLVYWDYYSTDYERYEKMINANKAFGKKVYFAGGAWTWKGFAPDNNFSIETTKVAVSACKNNGVSDFVMTLWGDDGAECSKFSVLPSLMYAAEIINGNEDIESIKTKFKKITGCDYDSLLILDKINSPGGGHSGTPHKYLLYNDLFLGLNDCRCTQEDNEYYSNLVNVIRSAKNKGEYKYIFDTLEKLSDVLSVKSNLGNKTRRFYKSGDKRAMNQITDEYEELIEKIYDFHSAFQRQWMIENKPHGFDVQDIRIGGLVQRIKSQKDRLSNWISGEIDSIPELEEVLIEGNCGKHWGQIVTPNVISFKF